MSAFERIVIDLNAEAHSALNCPAKLVIVPGAGHLFEEPGTLEVVVDEAREWFLRYLAGRTLALSEFSPSGPAFSLFGRGA